MLSLVKATLAAVVVLGAVSLAPTQASAAHRYHHPAYANPDTYGPPTNWDSRGVSLPSLSEPGPAQQRWFNRATQGFGAG